MNGEEESIEVLVPTAETRWRIGEQDITISWDDGELDGTVDITLHLAGETEGDGEPIAISTENDGLHTFTLTDVVDEGSYQVKIEHPNSGASAISAVFEITGFSSSMSGFRIISPTANTIWRIGEQDVSIRWTDDDNLGGEVDIELYRGEQLIETLITSTGNDGLFIYDVPSSLTEGSYSITVEHNTGVVANSEIFRIIGEEGGSISVTEPDAGTTWSSGESNVSIRWDDGELGGDVTIELRQGSQLIETITNSTNNDGEYSDFDVPTSIASGQYVVRVIHEDGSSDDSEQFSIEGEDGMISVTEPSSRTTWSLGESNVLIQWDDGGLGGDVDIELRQGSQLIETIRTSTNNDGEHDSYDVPTSIAPGQYIVRVTHENGSSGDSESFTITGPSELIVTEPTESTTWEAGENNVSIRWDDANLDGDVDIDLYLGTELVDQIVRSTNNDGSYNSYDVPSDLPGGLYQVKVTHEQSGIFGFSEAFLIRPDIEELSELILDDIEEFWDIAFEDIGLRYDDVRRLRFFSSSSSTISSCSLPRNRGPFYCSEDFGIYLGEEFMEEVFIVLGAAGGAIIISHLTAHHVQNLLGIFDGRARIPLHLEADCLTGNWVANVSQGRRELEFAAENLFVNGDESFFWFDQSIHGSPRDRLNAFAFGLNGGNCFGAGKYGGDSDINFNFSNNSSH